MHMKKYLLVFVVASVLAGCSTVPTDEDNFRILQRYTALYEAVDARLQTASSEAEYDSIVYALVDSTMPLLEENRGGELVYAVLPELFYYMSTDQKAAAFDGFREDSLKVAPFDKFHRAFLAEDATRAGCQYTDFAYPMPNGDTLALSSLVGQKDYLLVDFWASWCGPCRRSMPALKALYEEMSDRLDIVGVSLDAERDAWLQAIATLELPWYQMSDLQAWDCAPAATYGVISIPSTVLIDRSGLIVARNIAPATLRTLLRE